MKETTKEKVIKLQRQFGTIIFCQKDGSDIDYKSLPQYGRCPFCGYVLPLAEWWGRWECPNCNAT